MGLTKNESEYIEFKPQNGLVAQMKLSLVLNQRKIFLYDDVSENSIFECIYYLYKLMDMDKRTGEKSPIDIFINSNGGYVDDGLTLISLIEYMKDNGYDITTINMGRAYSMGFMISICGTHRKSYRYGRYMVHDISSCAYGKAQQMQEDIEDMKISRAVLYDIIQKYTSITLEQLTEWQEKKIDKFLSAQELLELKGVDEIL